MMFRCHDRSRTWSRRECASTAIIRCSTLATHCLNQAMAHALRPSQRPAVAAPRCAMDVAHAAAPWHSFWCDTFPRNHVQHNDAEPLGDGELAGR